MHFTKNNLINKEISQGKISYTDFSGESVLKYDLSSESIVWSSKLLEVRDLSKNLDIKELLINKFNQLKIEFILLGTEYVSKEDFLEKNSHNNEKESLKEFFKLLNIQKRKKEKNIDGFLEFLGLDVNLKNSLKISNFYPQEFFYFQERTEGIPAGKKRYADVYKIIINGDELAGYIFFSFSGNHDDINLFLDDLEDYLRTFGYGEILNLEDANQTTGLFSLNEYKYIDNTSLQEISFLSTISPSKYIDLLFESYDKNFDDFYRFHLKTSGKDFFISWGSIDETKKLNRMSLINLKPSDIKALENGNEEYISISDQVFDVLIQNYDLEKIRNLLLSSEFRNQGKDFFHFLDDRGVFFFEKESIQVSFRIRKFYEYESNKSNLDKFFVITSLTDDEYKKSFKLFNISESKIMNFFAPFDQSEFNLFIKKQALIKDQYLNIGHTSYRFRFDSDYKPNRLAFNSTQEATNYFLAQNEFIFHGIEFFITDKTLLNQEIFYIFMFEHDGNDDDFEKQILNLIKESSNLDNFNYRLNEFGANYYVSAEYSMNQVFEHNSEYHLIGEKNVQKYELFEYYILDYSFNNSTSIKITNLITSIKKNEIINFIGGSQEERQNIDFIKDQLSAHSMIRYIHFKNESKDFKSFISAIKNPNMISKHGYKIIPIDYYGACDDSERYKKTVLYFNHFDTKFYEIDLYTPYGEVDSDRLERNKNALFVGNGSRSGGLPIVSSGTTLESLFYYIENDSDIEDIGTLFSINSNKKYQSLRFKFKGKGFETLTYKDSCLDNKGEEKFFWLLMPNFKVYAFIYKSDSILNKFNYVEGLLNEDEFINLMKISNSSNQMIDTRGMLIKSHNIVANKNLYYYNKGEYYVVQSLQKKKLEFVYYGEQHYSSSGYGEEQKDNFIYAHKLIGITMPEKEFESLLLNDKRNSIINDYYVQDFEEFGSIKKYIDQYNMKYWFELESYEGHKIENYKKSNVYYFDQGSKLLWRIEKDYTFRIGAKKYTESGLMQCPVFEAAKRFGINGESKGYAFYNAIEIMNLANLSDSDQVILNSIGGHPCYTYQDKGTILEIYKKYI